MNVAELKTRCPRLYAEAFAAGVNAERRRILAAELIAGEEKSQPPQINSPAMVVERSRQFKECVARSMMLRSEIARQLCAL
jgi:hypothetical protein